MVRNNGFFENDMKLPQEIESVLSLVVSLLNRLHRSQPFVVRKNFATEPMTEEVVCRIKRWVKYYDHAFLKANRIKSRA